MLSGANASLGGMTRRRGRPSLRQVLTTPPPEITTSESHTWLRRQSGATTNSRCPRSVAALGALDMAFDVAPARHTQCNATSLVAPVKQAQAAFVGHRDQWACADDGARERPIGYQYKLPLLPPTLSTRLKTSNKWWMQVVDASGQASNKQTDNNPINPCHKSWTPYLADMQTYHANHEATTRS